MWRSLIKTLNWHMESAVGLIKEVHLHAGMVLVGDLVLPAPKAPPAPNVQLPQLSVRSVDVMVALQVRHVCRAPNPQIPKNALHAQGAERTVEINSCGECALCGFLFCWSGNRPLEGASVWRCCFFFVGGGRNLPNMFLTTLLGGSGRGTHTPPACTTWRPRGRWETSGLGRNLGREGVPRCLPPNRPTPPPGWGRPACLKVQPGQVDGSAGLERRLHDGALRRTVGGPCVEVGNVLVAQIPPEGVVIFQTAGPNTQRGG